jgi:hypothetical protein
VVGGFHATVSNPKLHVTLLNDNADHLIQAVVTGVPEPGFLASFLILPLLLKRRRRDSADVPRAVARS